MGLFWSMVPCKDQLDGVRLMKKNMETPFKTVVNVLSGHLSRTDLESHKPVLCSAVIERWYMAESVQRIEVSEGRIRGALFLPSGNTGTCRHCVLCDGLHVNWLSFSQQTVRKVFEQIFDICFRCKAETTLGVR